MKLRSICKAKIHRAVVTGAEPDYVGSIAIDLDLLHRADILPGEKVHIWNLNNGERLETYAIPAPAGSGEIVLNGAAARKVQKNDVVIIAAFLLTDEPVIPKMILVDARNAFVRELIDNQCSIEAESDLASPVEE